MGLSLILITYLYSHGFNLQLDQPWRLNYAFALYHSSSFRIVVTALWFFIKKEYFIEKAKLFFLPRLFGQTSICICWIMPWSDKYPRFELYISVIFIIRGRSQTTLIRFWQPMAPFGTFYTTMNIHDNQREDCKNSLVPTLNCSIGIYVFSGD